jgi:hypothetical protein
MHPFRLRAAGALVLGAVFALSFILPASGTALSVCAFRNAFGIPCPGCGLTRSFAAFSHGWLAEAFEMHPLGPVMYMAFAFYMVKWSVEAVLQRRLLVQIENRARLPALWGFLAAMLGIWVLRLATGTAC